MITLLIIDGLTDDTGDSGNILSETSNIYIPTLTGFLRSNGVICETVKLCGLEQEYSINGHTDRCLIYVPSFFFGKEMSFIYTDSTSTSSRSFRIASELRKLRSESDGKVVFVNSLHESDPFKRFSPIIVDNMCLDKEFDLAGRAKTANRLALTAAEALCNYSKIGFVNPLY